MKTIVPTKIGNISFHANSKRVIVKCKGFPSLRVESCGKQFMVVNTETSSVHVGLTPKKAYRRAVEAFWLGR